jgi:hypothetical protein
MHFHLHTVLIFFLYVGQQRKSARHNRQAQTHLITFCTIVIIMFKAPLVLNYYLSKWLHFPALKLTMYMNSNVEKQLE